MKNNLSQLIICVLMGVLAILLLNPFHVWMPDMVHMIVLVGLLVLFGVFAVFIIREKATDEREIWIRMLSGRISYLAGALVLVIAIAFEGIKGIVDPWLIGALLAMLVGKLVAYVYWD